MFAESVHCQLGVAQGNRKVVPPTHADRLRHAECELLTDISVTTG